MNVRLIAICLCGVAIALSAARTQAQESPEEDTAYFAGWKKSLAFDFTTTQTAYSDSWVGGEAGSVNWVSNLNGTARKYFEPWFEYRGRLKMSFGQTLSQDEETKDWSKPKKSTDLIDFENVGFFHFDAWIQPYAAFRLETQFYDGRHRNKKLYFSPLKLTESGGIAKQMYERDDDFITSRLGFAFRQIIKSAIVDSIASGSSFTYVTDDSTEIDGGIESVTDIQLSLRDNLQYTGKVTLYKALFFSEKDEVAGTAFEDDWKAIDVNWENILTAQITKILAVNLYTQLLYDKQVSKKSRIKETLAIGVAFKLM